MSTEYDRALAFARRVREHTDDYDDDMAMLARQFLRAVELTAPLRAEPASLDSEVWFCPNCARSQFAYMKDGKRLLDCDYCKWSFHIELDHYLRAVKHD